MKKRTIFHPAAWGILSAIVLIHAQEAARPPVVSGYASYEAGQVIKGYGIDGPYDHGWIQKATIGVGIDAMVASYLRVLVAGEANMGFSFKYNTQFIDQLRETQVPKTSFSIMRGEGLFSFSNSRLDSLQIEAGFFPYRTSPDARNLGEFLLRSTVNPAYIATTFDRLNSDVLGLRIGHSIRDLFHHDLLLTTEIYQYPMQDYSISYLARFNYRRIFELGAGGCLYRFLSIKDYYATPRQSMNIKSLKNPTSILDSAGNVIGDRYDTTYYSFAGNKIMFRFSFDPKGFFQAPFFGDEDLKLYGEAALLGTETDTLYYPALFKRMPIALGFNVPTFKLLDVLAVEMEYWESPFPNSYQRGFEQGLPLPTTNVSIPGTALKTKWSVYAKRSIGRNCRIIGQVARDHLMPISHSLSMGVQDRTDILLRIDDWWWVLKTSFNF